MKVPRCLRRWGSALLVDCCILMALVILKTVGEVKSFQIFTHHTNLSAVMHWHYYFFCLICCLSVLVYAVAIFCPLRVRKGKL